jgi:hypothetical protein
MAAGRLQVGRRPLDDDDDASVEAQAAISTPGAETRPKPLQCVPLGGVDRAIFQPLHDCRLEVGDAAAGLESQKRAPRRQRHDIDPRKPFQDGAVDDNERLPIANIDELCIGVRIPVCQGSTFFDQGHDGPRRILVDLSQPPNHGSGERECDDLTGSAKLRGPATLSMHVLEAPGYRPDCRHARMARKL